MRHAGLLPEPSLVWIYQNQAPAGLTDCGGGGGETQHFADVTLHVKHGTSGPHVAIKAHEGVNFGIAGKTDSVEPVPSPIREVTRGALSRVNRVRTRPVVNQPSKGRPLRWDH